MNLLKEVIYMNSSAPMPATDPNLLIDTFRQEVDAVIKKCEEIQRMLSSGTTPNPELMRCLALVRTNLQQGKMWGGKCLEAMGSQLPIEFRDEAK
jgi:hypothetical protein